MATNKDPKAALVEERKKINAKASQSVADKKRLTVIATELEALKNAKFVELAEKRVTKAINSIRSVAKLASSNYVSTEAQVLRISEVLKEEVINMNLAFSSKGGATKESFKL